MLVAIGKGGVSESGPGTLLIPRTLFLNIRDLQDLTDVASRAQKLVDH